MTHRNPPSLRTMSKITQTQRINNWLSALKDGTLTKVGAETWVRELQSSVENLTKYSKSPRRVREEQDRLEAIQEAIRLWNQGL